MYKDDRGRIQFQSEKSIYNYPTLVSATLTICEAVMEAIKAKLSNVIIERDYQVCYSDNYRAY